MTFLASSSYIQGQLFRLMVALPKEVCNVICKLFAVKMQTQFNDIFLPSPYYYYLIRRKKNIIDVHAHIVFQDLNNEAGIHGPEAFEDSEGRNVLKSVNMFSRS